MFLGVVPVIIPEEPLSVDYLIYFFAIILFALFCIGWFEFFKFLGRCFYRFICWIIRKIKSNRG